MSRCASSAVPPSSEQVLTVTGVSKVLPGNRTVLNDVTVSFLSGAKIGVVGPNGAGKSTLLKLLAGTDQEFDGEIWVRDGLRIGHLAQEPELDASRSVHENIMDGLKFKTDLVDRFNELSNGLSDPDADMTAIMAEMETVQERIEALDAWSLDHLVDIAKGALNVPPDDADVASLSGGERRRVALCRLLLEQPDVLLLDEPTNHLDAESVHWLEEFLAAYKGTVLAITHDRYFLNQVAGWILEVDRGNLYAYSGNYSTWLEKKQGRLDLESKADARRARAMQQELEWIRQSPKGRQRKSKARIQAFETAKGDDAKVTAERRFLSGAIAIPPAPRVGAPIVRMKDLELTLDDGRTLIKSLSFNLPPGAIVGVVGANGAGKSTLMRVIAGELAASAGEVEVGSLVQLGHVEQSRFLSPEETVGSVISEGLTEVRVGETSVPMMQWLAKFNLSTMAKKRVKSLSGGERSRVHLARTLKTPCNVLILDEPTNDLDVDTLRSLEEAMDEYNGCAFIVSHDRFFLDRVCTHTVSFEGEGDVIWFAGPWSAYEQYRQEHLPHLHARAQSRLDGSSRAKSASHLSK